VVDGFLRGDVNVSEPFELIVGDTAQWRKSISSFQVDTRTTIHPIPDGWDLSYALRGPSVIDIPAIPDGSEYLVSVPASVTATWIAGHYYWQSYLTKGPDRYSDDAGQMVLKSNLTSISGPYDGRTHVKKVLDAIEATIEGRVTTDIASYSIGGRSISKLSPEELIKARQLYLGEYQAELEAARIANGMGTNRNILVRFRGQ
jgi:hypothetical protein